MKAGLRPYLNHIFRTESAIPLNKNDIRWMKRALELAQLRGGQVSPNPRVGAVLVKNGRKVGEGAHLKFGGPHAEIHALRQAGSRARGATLYVNLEPCAHRGKTPPCVDALVQNGIKRVVASLQDPFPLVKGKGFAQLRRAGVSVEVGLLENEARALNENFLFSVARKRPKVILKAAISLDGRIATRTGASRWVTGDKARRKAHELRSQSDAILVGVETVLKDDPSLTVRKRGFHRKDGWPLRIVLDSDLRLPPKARILKKGPRTLVFTSHKASVSRQKTLEKQGTGVFRVPDTQKMLSLRAILNRLYQMGVRTLLVEGGGRVHGSFLKERLADEAALFIAPKVFGEGPAWARGWAVPNPQNTPWLKDVKVERLGDDWMLTGRWEK
jgi:diaminohydroxyphosphoribosylaminopyrimidine deaminase/5-amino-6-(5-phosphoribosylamino)uracil reductase